MLNRTHLFFTLAFVMVFGAFAAKIGAQSPQCPYKTKILVYKDSQSGSPLSRVEVAPRNKWGVYNNKQGRLIKAGEFGDTAQMVYENANEKLDGGYERYRPGEQASVTLSGFEIGTKWKIKELFCDDSKSAAKSCPKNIKDQARTQTISGFTVNCGTDITYGWILEKIPSSTTTPPPAGGSLVSPTNPVTPPKSPSLDSTAFQLDVWTPGSSSESCYVAVDTKTGHATSRKPHCRAFSCKNPTGQVTGLIVDYQNQSASGQQLTMSGQTNRCANAEISASTPACTTKLQRLDSFYLPYRDTMRCIWKNIDSSNKIECRKLADGTKTINEIDTCRAEMNLTSNPTVPNTPTLPTRSATPPNTPSPTPPKSCSCDRINQPNLQENVCNSGCSVFHTTGNSCNYTSDCTKRTRVTPTNPTSSPRVPNTPTLPTSTPTISTSFFNKENIILNWNFLALEDKKKDTHIWALKVGVCDSPSSAKYAKKTPKAGGNGAKCKWYNTEVTKDIITNAKPGGRIGHPDRRMRSTRPAVNMMLDYDDKPIQKDKIYYITCQYYAGTTAPTQEEIRKAAINDNDEWRRCEPRAATTSEELIFPNILDPNTYIGRIAPDVILSDGGTLQTPPKESQAYLGVGLHFDFSYFEKFPNVYIGPLQVQAIRAGICPFEPITGGDFDKCIFSPPQPLSDLRIDPKSKQNTSQKYFFFTTDANKKPINLSQKYFATCQYVLKGRVNIQNARKYDLRDFIHPDFTEIRRCWPQQVTPHAYYGRNPKIDLPWANVLDTLGSFELLHPSYGSISLFSQLEADEESVAFTVCNPDTDECVVHDQNVFPSDTDRAIGSSIISSIGEERIVEDQRYTVTCQTSSGKVCAPITIRSGDPVYLGQSGAAMTLASASLRCDQNNDGACNALDIAVCTNAQNPPKSCDIDLDGTVNATDYSVSLKQLGE